MPPFDNLTGSGKLKTVSRKAAAWILAAGLSALILTSCLPFSKDSSSIQTFTDPGFSSRTTDAAETSREATDQTESASSAATAAATNPVSFEDQVSAIILAGLNERRTEISIDDAIEPRSVPASEIESLIDRVFSVYQTLFLEHPEFFYLNGSINVSYSKEGQQGYLVSMTVKPVYWEKFADLDDSKLAKMINDVEAVVSQVSADIRSQTGVPWQQLLLLHDWLVSHIVYDSTLNQQTNNMYSALIEGSTLCQGYAQSFQLIAQRMGFTVVMVMGDADGIGHAWNVVKLDGKYYHVDVTFDDPLPDGGSAGPVEHVYFLRSDSQLAENHVWDKNSAPACPDDSARYYTENDLTVASMNDLTQAIDDFVAAIDFNQKKANRLELLYKGTLPPSDSELEDIVRAALKKGAPGFSILFSHRVSLMVVTVEITPD